MLFWIISGAILLYVGGSYYYMYKNLKGGAGPAGLGWIAFPFAPLMTPVIIWNFIKGAIHNATR